MIFFVFQTTIHKLNRPMNVIFSMTNKIVFFISLHNIEEPHALTCISLLFLNENIRNYMHSSTKLNY